MVYFLGPVIPNPQEVFDWVFEGILGGSSHLVGG